MEKFLSLFQNIKFEIKLNSENKKLLLAQINEFLRLYQIQINENPLQKRINESQP